MYHFLLYMSKHITDTSSHRQNSRTDSAGMCLERCAPVRRGHVLPPADILSALHGSYFTPSFPPSVRGWCLPLVAWSVFAPPAPIERQRRPVPTRPL